MLRLLRVHAKQPIGGHVYKGHGHELRGATVDGVIALMVDYRGTNALPLGDPEHDLALEYQKLAPWLVTGTLAQDPVSEVQRYDEWIQRAWRGRGNRMDSYSPDTLDRRTLCRECPHFAPDMHHLPNEYGRWAGIRETLMAGATTDVLGFCRHHGWPTFIAARLETPAALALLPAPESCWVKSA